MVDLNVKSRTYDYLFVCVVSEKPLKLFEQTNVMSSDSIYNELKTVGLQAQFSLIFFVLCFNGGYELWLILKLFKACS